MNIDVITYNMGTQNTILQNIEPGYDVYVLEVTHEPDSPLFRDEVIETIEGSFTQASIALGADGVYIRPISRRAHEQSIEFLSRMDISHGNRKLPKLVITERPPLEMQSGDKCIVFNLNHMENSTEVSELYETIADCVEDDEFMKELTIEEKKREIERTLEGISTPLGLVVSLASLL